MVNCNYCIHVSVTEEQQKDKKIDHICRLHGIRLIHRSNNPKIEHNFIYPCEKCDGRNFKPR